MLKNKIKVSTDRSGHYPRVPTAALDLVSQTINQYQLFDSDSVCVAYSGGKDSLFTMMLFRELGYKVNPVIIDMGYERNWGHKVKQLARNVGFDADVITARSQAVTRNANFKKIAVNIETLNKLAKQKTIDITPCTACYNTKALLLEDYAIANGVSTVIFGQHLIDAIASMLKLAYMYIDRWDNENPVFNQQRFGDLVDDSLSQFCMPRQQIIKTPIFQRLKNLCFERKAATDDPIVQTLQGKAGKIKLVRPLFFIRESLIEKFIIKEDLKTEGSGCGHGATKGTQTPREIVHYRMLKKIDQHDGDDSILNDFKDLVLHGLNAEGRLMVNVRNARRQLLGEQYKVTGGCQSEKV